MKIIEYIKQKLGIGKKQKLLMEHNPKTIEETKIAEITNKDTKSTKQKTALEKYKVEKTPKIYENLFFLWYYIIIKIKGITIHITH